MQRPIKFRAWNEKMKQMREVETIDFISKEIVISHGMTGTDTSIWKFDQCILMQLTGAKDENGKEIFEHDILKVTDTDNENSWLSKVYYDGGALAIDVEGEEYGYISIGWTNDWIKYEVLGNIHQHKIEDFK